jgi:hypothetical protein
LTIVGGHYGVELGDLYGCDSDIVTHYRFDENGGDTIYDSNWCEDWDDLEGDVDGASWTTGFWDGALDFDGDNDYVEIDHTSVFNVSAVSISAWINLDDNDTDRRVIVSNFNNDDDDAGYELQVYDNAKLRFLFGYGTDFGTCISDTEIEEDRWYHVAGIYTGSTIKLYINGELDNSCIYNEDLTSSSNDVLIGASDHNDDGNLDNHFDGTIDDVAIWGAALTLTEIERIFWGGEDYRPIVNASNGGYSFKLSVDNTQLKNFEVQYGGSEGSDSAQYGDAGVRIYTADSVKLYNVVSKYNKHGIRIWSSEPPYCTSKFLS